MFTVTYESRSLNNKRRDQKENEITLASRKKETEILFSLGNRDYFLVGLFRREMGRVENFGGKIKKENFFRVCLVR